MITRPSPQKEWMSVCQELRTLNDRIFECENSQAIQQNAANAKKLVADRLALDSLRYQEQQVEKEITALQEQQKELGSIPVENVEEKGEADLSSLITRQEKVSEEISRKEEMLKQYSGGRQNAKSASTSRKKPKIVPMEALSSEALIAEIEKLQSRLKQLKEDIQLENAEEQTQNDESVERLIEQSRVIEEGMNALNALIENTNVRVRKLNEATFETISKHFKSFCKRLVGTEAFDSSQIPEKDIEMISSVVSTRSIHC